MQETDSEINNFSVTQGLEEIPLVTPREVAKEIKDNLNTRKAPGYDLITGELIKKLPKKGVVKLTNLINAAIRLKYVPSIWKMAEIIMVLKPGKPENETSSYRPISLLTVISKLFEKLILKRMKPILERKMVIPEHQFGFREKHTTIEQVHRITNIIEMAYEDQKICSTIFLDIAQAFDKVWHEGLMNKIKQIFSIQFTELLQSYITEKTFRVKQEEEYSNIRDIKAEVPQGSVLGPVLYLIYTYDMPVIENIHLATFADDTAVLAIGTTIEESTYKLQRAIEKVINWTKKWKIKINARKTIHVNFTNKIVQHNSITVNNEIIPNKKTAKYLGMNLDARLTWKEHIKTKKKELDLRFKQMYWLIGKKSPLSVYNKILLYKQILKPVWIYGIQLWGCAKQSNVAIIQKFQNKVIRNIVNAPWYIRNDNLHKDLNIPTVIEEIKKYATNHEERLHRHANAEALQLLNNVDIKRRLKRVKPYDLV